MDLHHKDMGIVTDAARNVGAALPVGAVVAQLVASLRTQGDGGLDHSALLRAVERLSGAEDLSTRSPKLPGGAGADTCPVAPRRGRARISPHPSDSPTHFNKLLTSVRSRT